MVAKAIEEMSAPEKKENPAQPTLEAAMDRLDAIVREMEAGELPLEELITRYEEGIALSKLCRERLESAEERIRIITRDSQGNPVLEDFDANATQ